MKSKLINLTGANFNMLINPSRMLGSGNTDNSKKSMGAFIGIGLLLLYFAGIAAAFSAMLYRAFKPIGIQELMPAMYTVGTTLFILISAVFSGHGFLFSSKDLQVLFSLPVTKRQILFSKFSVFYIYNLLFSSLIILPSSFVFCYFEGLSFVSYIISVFVALLLPLLPVSLGSLLTYVIGLATKKSRHKNLFRIIFVFVLCGGIFYLSQNTDVLIQYITEKGAFILDGINAYYFPASLAVKAINGGVVSLLLFAVVNILPAFAAIGIIAVKYRQIVASYNQSFKKENYVYKNGKKDSKYMSCLKKELRRLFSSANYVINSASGIFLILVFSIGFFSNDKLYSTIIAPEFAKYYGIVIALAATFACTMTTTTSSSVSLEGKSLWIYRCCPIKPITVLYSKLSVNLLLNLPITLIFCIVLSAVQKVDILTGVLATVIPLLAVLLTSYEGLLINLAKPRFDWQNEIQVIKQSASTLLVMLTDFAVTLLIAGGLIVPLVVWDIPFSISGSVMTALLLIAVLVLDRSLNKYGVKRFEAL